MNSGYCFPIINMPFDTSEANDLNVEIDKLYDELKELEKAKLEADEEKLFFGRCNPHKFNLAVEIVDCMHVCETMLRILCVSDEELSKLQYYVTLKNELRGYYDEDESWAIQQ